MSAARYIRGTGRVLEFGNLVLNLASPLEDEIGIIEQSPELGRGFLKFTGVAWRGSAQCISGLFGVGRKRALRGCAGKSSAPW